MKSKIPPQLAHAGFEFGGVDSAEIDGHRENAEKVKTAHERVREPNQRVAAQFGYQDTRLIFELHRSGSGLWHVQTIDCLAWFHDAQAIAGDQAHILGVMFQETFLPLMA